MCCNSCGQRFDGGELGLHCPTCEAGVLIYETRPISELAELPKPENIPPPAPDVESLRKQLRNLRKREDFFGSHSMHALACLCYIIFALVLAGTICLGIVGEGFSLAAISVATGFLMLGFILHGLELLTEIRDYLRDK